MTWSHCNKHRVDFEAYCSGCEREAYGVAPDPLDAELDTQRALFARLATDFKRHLDVMSEVNAHLGYKFSQPLITAREALKVVLDRAKETEEK